MRLRELAEIVAGLDGVSVEETHMRLRNPLFKTLFQSSPGLRRNSPADYSPQELLRARLLLACADCGLKTDELQKVNDALGTRNTWSNPAPESAKVAGGVHYPSGLKTIIRGTKAGEEWFLTIRFTRTSDGQRCVTARVRWSEWSDTENRGSRALNLLHGETHIGTLSIPASALIAPLLTDEI